MQERSIPLLGEKTIAYLAQAHIAVFGVGGVGSYAVEALARHGVGHFSIFDHAKVTISNKNRQLIALDSTLDEYKCDVIKKRILDINKNAIVDIYTDTVTEDLLKHFDFSKVDYVLDCIDDIQGKLAIIEACIHFKRRIISCCGTGNKLDPMKFKIADLSKTSVCPLAKKLRIELRKKNIVHLNVLYSTEEPLVKTNFISSVSFVPSIAGLLLARHIIMEFHQIILASRTHLVLEGGGMKGVYTDGVLDCFLDHQIEFDSIYGVSAGACAATSFLSKQSGRSYHAMVDYIGNPEYASKRSLVRTGNYFNKDFVYHKLPEELIPFDYETAHHNNCKLYAVVTNVETGHAEYHECIDYYQEIDYICASSSLPLLSEIQKIDGKGYLDGGLSDPIPYLESKKNAIKNVIVLTKPKDYKCEKTSSLLMNAIKIKYHKYPKLIKALERRHIQYNQTLKYIEQDKNVIVIRPSQDMAIDRLETDKNKLESLYRLGYEDALKKIDEIKLFMKKEKQE